VDTSRLEREAHKQSHKNHHHSSDIDSYISYQQTPNFIGPEQLSSNPSMLGERSHLTSATDAFSGKRGPGLHLLISLAFLLIPLALSIAILSAERGTAEHLMPWSTSSVGWASLKGDFAYGLTQFSLCKSGDTSMCTSLRYDEQAMLKEGNSMQSAGNAIMWMMGISAVLVALSAGLTFWALVKRDGAAATRGVKIASWIMSLIVTILFLTCAMIWSSNMHDKLSNYTDPHYSWGFALAIVGGLSAAFATILQCLRPGVEDSSYRNV
jgi:hypothetical protein